MDPPHPDPGRAQTRITPTPSDPKDPLTAPGSRTGNQPWRPDNQPGCPGGQTFRANVGPSPDASHPPGQAGTLREVDGIRGRAGNYLPDDEF